MSRNRKPNGRSQQILNHRFPNRMWGIPPHCGGSQSLSLIRSSACVSFDSKRVTFSCKIAIPCHLLAKGGGTGPCPSPGERNLCCLRFRRTQTGSTKFHEPAHTEVSERYV